MNDLHLQLVRLLRGAKRGKPVEVGNVRFYHFWKHPPQRGQINVPWIKDLRVAQFAMAGHIEGYLQEAIKYLREDRARFSPANAFVAPTQMFANEVMKWYGTERPWFQFANYPSRVVTLPKGDKRHEVVYVDYSSTVFQVDFYRRLFSLFDQLHVLSGMTSVLLVNIFKHEVESIRHGHHIRVLSLHGGYDLKSRFGILVNLTNFKQAAECLPRKLLLYLHWGMVPLIHATFAESIQYCRKRGIPPVVYYGVKELVREVDTMVSWPRYDRMKFCVENRIGDLEAYLKGLG